MRHLHRPICPLSGEIKPFPSLRPTKPLLEKLELLVDGLLGGLHLDETVDEAQAVGLNPLFEVGDLEVDLAGLLGQGVLPSDERAVVADRLLEIGLELRCDALVRVVEEGLESAEIIGDGVVQRGFVFQRQLIGGAGGVDADLGQRIEGARQPCSLVESDGAQFGGDFVGVAVAGQRGACDLANRVGGAGGQGVNGGLGAVVILDEALDGALDGAGVGGKRNG